MIDSVVAYSSISPYRNMFKQLSISDRVAPYSPPGSLLSAVCQDLKIKQLGVEDLVVTVISQG